MEKILIIHLKYEASIAKHNDNVMHSIDHKNEYRKELPSKTILSKLATVFIKKLYRQIAKGVRLDFSSN